MYLWVGEGGWRRGGGGARERGIESILYGYSYSSIQLYSRVKLNQSYGVTFPPFLSRLFWAQMALATLVVI